MSDERTVASSRADRTWRLTGARADTYVAVEPHEGSNAQAAEEIVHAEIGRLEQVFGIDDDTSMLNRWIVDPSTRTSNEFDELLSTALRWQRSSRGVFNVSTRRLRDLWEQAAADGCQPSPGEMHELAIDIADAPYRFEGHLLRRLRDCRGLDLSAIVTAFVVDAAVEAASWRCDLSGLTVSADDKIVHPGSPGIDIGIEALTDRFGDFPTLTLRDAAVAVRLGDRRGVGGRATNVFDPLTGHRVSDGVSVAVVAPDATTADAVATMLDPRRAARPAPHRTSVIPGRGPATP